MEARRPCTGVSPVAFLWVPIPLRYSLQVRVDRLRTRSGLPTTYDTGRRPVQVGLSGSIVLLWLWATERCPLRQLTNLNSLTSESSSPDVRRGKWFGYTPFPVRPSLGGQVGAQYVRLFHGALRP